MLLRKHQDFINHSIETKPHNSQTQHLCSHINNRMEGKSEEAEGGRTTPPPSAMTLNSISKPPPSNSHNGHQPAEGHEEPGVGLSYEPREQQENVVLRRGFVPRTAPERLAQRKCSMAQLQQWVNQRRGMASQEDINRPPSYYSVNQEVSAGYYNFVDEYSLYLPGVRPDSICSMSAVGGYDRLWTIEQKRHSLRDEPHRLYRKQMPQDQWGPQYYGGMETSMRSLFIQPRSKSVPRSPSSSSRRPYSPASCTYASPARSLSNGFDRFSGRMNEDAIYPPVYSLRRSFSSPKYNYHGERRSLNQGLYHHNYPVSPSVHSKMEDILDFQLQRNLDYLDQQVPPFQDINYRELHPTLKLNEIETSKLLGRLCEQNQILKDHEAVVHRLRMNKDSLEEALLATHQEMEIYHNQPLIMEKLQFKKETQQNQLINIRGELSQASSALTTACMEFEALEDEANAIHGDLWEQLNAGGQSELVRRHIQKEFWRVQDVLEGLQKNSLSRGIKTAKGRVDSGASGSFTTNSPASPLSSVSLTSPLSPYSPVPVCQASPTKELGLKPKFGESNNISDVQEQAQDRQSAMNKVGIVPPRTKSPTDESQRNFTEVHRRNSRVLNGVSRERPKSAAFPTEIKMKMSVEEQNERLRRNQCSSMRDKRRSLNLSGGQSPANYKVVRRRLTAHEIDIKDLEKAVRGQGQESPEEEIARLRRLQIEPEHYNISKEMAPDKVLIPERYLDVENNTLLSPEEQKEKQKKLERIKTLIAKSKYSFNFL
ncbi:pleckstrin homology domain-containing family A member 6 isoform X5 [Haplochromis burtoni]|uniref:pleckstrin homology domain-containing family A member 6 isoform X5 n=1 Tax=Haplochromis burtoni TaxID=8153 RepID=UPI001C2DA47F|nr:pleckstrin homology domain-containing family A member 6 isoform X5 [Haplochromis burtoni]